MTFTRDGRACLDSRQRYARAYGMRSWPLAWSRTDKWHIRGAPRYGICAALYKLFSKKKGNR